MSDRAHPAPHSGDERTPDEPTRPTIPVRQADPRLALLAVAVLCVFCLVIGFALGRTL